jgi:hypothetical protein
VTSADLHGVARQLRIANLGEWPKTAALPATIAAAVPATAAGRIGILSSIDLEKVRWTVTGASAMNARRRGFFVLRMMTGGLLTIIL